MNNIIDEVTIAKMRLGQLLNVAEEAFSSALLFSETSEEEDIYKNERRMPKSDPSATTRLDRLIALVDPRKNLPEELLPFVLKGIPDEPPGEQYYYALRKQDADLLAFDYMRKSLNRNNLLQFVEQHREEGVYYIALYDVFDVCIYLIKQDSIGISEAMARAIYKLAYLFKTAKTVQVIMSDRHHLLTAAELNFFARIRSFLFKRNIDLERVNLLLQALVYTDFGSDAQPTEEITHNDIRIEGHNHNFKIPMLHPFWTEKCEWLISYLADRKPEKLLVGDILLQKVPLDLNETTSDFLETEFGLYLEKVDPINPCEANMAFRPPKRPTSKQREPPMKRESYRVRSPKDILNQLRRAETSSAINFVFFDGQLNNVFDSLDSPPYHDQFLSMIFGEAIWAESRAVCILICSLQIYRNTNLYRHVQELISGLSEDFEILGIKLLDVICYPPNYLTLNRDYVLSARAEGFDFEAKSTSIDCTSLIDRGRKIPNF